MWPTYLFFQFVICLFILLVVFSHTKVLILIFFSIKFQFICYSFILKFSKKVRILKILIFSPIISFPTDAVNWINPNCKYSNRFIENKAIFREQGQRSHSTWPRLEGFIDHRWWRQSETGTVPKYGTKLSPLAGTTVPFHCSEFSQHGQGWGEVGQIGFSSLHWNKPKKKIRREQISEAM